mgnify:CR=1 FL=1
MLDKLNSDLNNILEPKKQIKMRKAVLGDFMTTPNILSLPTVQYEKPKNYRIQDEYGEKKFIKP